MVADSQREILTPDQAADLLQVSTMFVYRLIHDGTLRAVRIGKFWRVTKAEIFRACSRPKMRARRKVA
jgi:excisionase family DNA binding protein